MELTINHMYSQSLNIYGDIGNIISLKYRGSLYNINVKTVNTEINSENQTADIYFIGGGQDKDQIYVFEDLLKRKDFIVSEVEKGKIFLLICGGYQLFGKFFVDGDGNILEGLNILDIETKALDTTVASRCIGNVVVEMHEDFITKWDIDTKFSKYLVGFENHGGQTRVLSDKVKPLGKVICGFGNNSFDKLEGCYYKNIIGSYLHGSILPKNPHLTDAILKKALQSKYGERLEVQNTDTSIEKQAHYHILKRLGIVKTFEETSPL